MKYDVVIIGGGLAGVTAGIRLQKAGKECCIISGGLSLNDVPRQEFIALGGAFLTGGRVLGGLWNGDELESLVVSNLEGTGLCADNYILATGKFFSKGLVATMDNIYEPLFGCDVEFEPDRGKWYDPDFFAPQPFERFGVKTQDGRVLRDGVPMKNLYAAGEILAGDIDIVNSALDVCNRII